MKILAIETSCDETAIAVLSAQERAGSKKDPRFELLSNVVLSQVKLHKPYGGVVPNLAQREHQKNLVPIVLTALTEAGLLQGNIFPIYEGERSGDGDLKEILSREPELLKKFLKQIAPLSAPDIDAIAVTYGPGLEPALWVGVNFAKALSYLWKKPLIPINHLEGHIYASWLSAAPGKKSDFQGKADFKDGAIPKFPLLALIVSGGHTELVLMKKHLDYKILGETRDDAAGEAFDKVAKMLELGYPGGPEISKLALEGSPTSFNFPRPMINSNDFDFSFSGLKTAVLYHLRENKAIFPRLTLPRNAVGSDASQKSPSFRSDTAASFQQAIVDVLIAKTKRALLKYPVKSLVVGGGVAANRPLRSALEKLIFDSFPNISLHISPVRLTGDNASMIAAAAYFKAIGKKKIPNAKNLKAKGNLKLA